MSSHNSSRSIMFELYALWLLHQVIIHYLVLIVYHKILTVKIIDEFDENLSIRQLIFKTNPTEHGAAILLLALHIK